MLATLILISGVKVAIAVAVVAIGGIVAGYAFRGKIHTGIVDAGQAASGAASKVASTASTVAQDTAKK